MVYGHSGQKLLATYDYLLKLHYQDALILKINRTGDDFGIFQNAKQPVEAALNNLLYSVLLQEFLLLDHQDHSQHLPGMQPHVPVIVYFHCQATFQ